MKNKILIIGMCVLTAATVFARPHGHGRGHHRPTSHRVHHHHHRPHYHHSHRHWVGPAIVGGSILGAALVNSFTPRTETVVIQQPVVTTPTVVQQPVVVNPTPVVVQPTRVWVPGHYVTRNVNGVIVQDWIPGRYELR